MLTILLDFYMISIYNSELGQPQIGTSIANPVVVIMAQILALIQLTILPTGMTLETVYQICGRYTITIGMARCVPVMFHVLPLTKTWVATAKQCV